MLALLPFLVVLAATPATLPAQLAAAQPGDTLDLRGGRFADLVLRNLANVTLRGGTFTPTGHLTAKSAGALDYGPAVACFNCRGVTFDGAAFVGPESAVVGQPYVGADGYGLQFMGGAGVKVINSTFAGFKVGLLLGGVDGFLVQNNSFERMRADGLDAAGWHGRITGNFFMATRVLNGEHPDAAQLESQTFQAPTAHIEIDHNIVLSRSQGLTAFDHGAGGFEDINLHDNIIAVDAGQAIGEVAVRSGVTANNRVYGLPGSTVHSNINTASSPAIVRCGNAVAPSAGKKGLGEAACNPIPPQP